MSRWKKVGLGVAALSGVAFVGIAGLVAYAEMTGDARLSYPDTPYPEVRASADPEVIARGRYLVHGPAHCAQCHSTPDRDHPEQIATHPLTGGLAFEMGPIGTRYSANLTPDPETGIGARTDAELARAVLTGVTHDGSLSFFMRFSAGRPSEEDLGAIISYLRSLEPKRNELPKSYWTTMGRVLLTYGMPAITPRTAPAPTHVPFSDEPSVARGEYLADNVMLCTTCHTRFDEASFEPVGPKAGGSQADPSHGDDSDKEFVAPNLTSHPTGMTGKLEEDAFVARLKGGRVYASSIMPWENFAAVEDADLRSVYRYLRSLPPVDNDVGPTYRDVGWTRE